MKAFISLLLASSIALISCDSSSNTVTPKTKNNSSAISSFDQLYSSIPLHFKDADGFKLFLDTSQYSDQEKVDMINEFFDNTSQYSTDELTQSFASIGANVEWNVDLISQFRRNMQITIMHKPEMLVAISNQLTEDELKRFSNFYDSHVIWNDVFPSELYYLKTHDPRSFKVFIDTFYERYQAMSKNKLNQSYLITDRDGYTNIREQANTQSDIVGTIDNDQPVIGLWKENNWVFIYDGSDVGYIHSGNLTLDGSYESTLTR